MAYVVVSSGNNCSAGYWPSVQSWDPDTGFTGYNTQFGSTCPCTCYPDTLEMPSIFTKQSNCAADCMKTVQ